MRVRESYGECSRILYSTDICRPEDVRSRFNDFSIRTHFLVLPMKNLWDLTSFAQLSLRMRKTVTSFNPADFMRAICHAESAHNTAAEY